MAPRARMQPHPLCEAIFAGDEVEVRRIIASAPTCVNSPESSGMTALMLCAAYKQPEIARILIARGANVNAGEVRWGLTALHLAARNHCAPLVQLLIESGALVDQCDEHSHTALWHAVMCYAPAFDASTFELLIQAGANPWLRDKFGDTPTDMARRSEQGTGRFFENVPDAK
jgi:ankyrin repeat protein